MGDMFRSDKMLQCQLYLQFDAAYDTLEQLGESACVQFRDLNDDQNASQRKFINEVRRCDELQRILRYIGYELRQQGIDFSKIVIDEEPRAANPREIINLETQLESIEEEMRTLSDKFHSMNADFQLLSELGQVLIQMEGFFADTGRRPPDSGVLVDNDDTIPLYGNHNDEGLGSVVGVISLERFFSFERILWRISHGNIVLRRREWTETAIDGKERPEQKVLFIALYKGELVKKRIMKVCAGFHVTVVPCPTTAEEREEKITEILQQVSELQFVLLKTADHRKQVFLEVSQRMPFLIIGIKKMKAIYHTLNLFNVSKQCLIGEAWIPERHFNSLQRLLRSISSDGIMPSFLDVIEPNQKPPTYIRTNKFTRGFQSLIDAYGIGSYREVNPALYTCITFPFLFAVMFGDAGHGMILTLVGLWMVLSERKLGKIGGEIFQLFFGGRYIILLMGIFSIYTGFVYNDVFSKSMNIFGSAWKANWNASTVLSNKHLQMNPDNQVFGVYAVGVDPVWQLASNKIIFLNTFKMKLSIIFGVLHMVFGITLSLVNFVQFKKYSSIFFVFLPQILFLLQIFGYMVFMMFYKFIMFSAKAGDIAHSPACAPSILILFINMMLSNKLEVPHECKRFMFDGQDEWQQKLRTLALLCIPWLLLGKPLWILFQRRKTQTNVQNINSEEPMSEIFIHQTIHTIEYILSTISHTASYLRLWALSLAHAQLSEVLWMMVLKKGFSAQGSYGGIILVAIFAAWSLLTVAILILIEGLSAFLHTLRLHWVEFMSKFYEGIGCAFQPFSFQSVLEEDDM